MSNVISNNLDKINVTLIGAVATAVAWAYGTFATASEVQELEISIAYGQYYDRLDDYEEAIAEGREALANEYARQMEILRAKICKQDPDWERCRS